MARTARDLKNTVRFGTKTVNIRMMPEEHERIKDVAAERRISMQEWIYQACENQLKRDESPDALPLIRPTQFFYGK